MRILNYSENSLEKDAKGVTDCDGEHKQKNQCDKCHKKARRKQCKSAWGNLKKRIIIH